MNPGAIDDDLRRRVERDELAGVSYAIVRGGEVVARNCIGWADREARVPLREDHLFRAFSNTKLVTCLAALRLVQEGRLRLDDQVDRFIPAFAGARVLRPGAASLNDTRAPREPLRVRHLLTHTAGMTYAFFEPELPLAEAYQQVGTRDPMVPLAEMVERVASLPLLYQPGEGWSYSVAVDVVGRILEIVEVRALDEVLRARVLDPLGMHDTGFVVPRDRQHLLTTLYVGDLVDPSKPGLERADDLPYPDAYRKPFPRLNPGGGLVTSLGDSTRLVQCLLSGGEPLLRKESMGWVFDNQLPPGQWIGFPGEPQLTGRGHSYVGSVTVQETDANPHVRPGDLEWGGMAGTHWLVSPRGGYACVLMTQRYMGYGLPFWTAFKKNLREAMEAAG